MMYLDFKKIKTGRVLSRRVKSLFVAGHAHAVKILSFITGSTPIPIETNRSRLVWGFTLIEAMISIFAFSLVFVAVLGMTARGVRGNAYATNELIAQYLASEGLEVVEVIRSDNIIEGVPWIAGLDGCLDGCTIDTTPNAYTASDGTDFQVNDSCNSITQTCAQLYEVGNSVKVYSHESSTTLSPFSRIITIAPAVEDSTAYLVVSQVRWQIPGLPARSVIVRKVMKNWY